MKLTQIHVLLLGKGQVCRSLSERLTRAGLQTQETDNPAQAFDLIRPQWPDVVVMEAELLKGKGTEILRQIHQLNADLRVILVTGSPDFHEATEAIRAGAHDYLESPSNNDEIVAAIHRAWFVAHRQLELCPEEEDGSKECSLRQLMGPSEKIRQLAAQVALVAPTNYSVVIMGETGAGKELVAQAIHSLSTRAEERFLSMDCGAVSESLIENEFFGHERGAYTGADRIGIGRFEAALGGTMFLDEITNFSLGMQSKLLRVLEEKKIFRVGSTHEIPVDVRVLAATNRDLAFLIRANAFREDLFHRLSEYVIEVPPLRERRSDILFLATRFLQGTDLELGKCVRGFSDAAAELLLSYHWPGNVRELRNVVRGAVLQTDEVIEPKDLRIRVAEGKQVSFNAEVLCDSQLSLKQIVQQNTDQIERTVLLQTLERAGGNKAKAARMLGIDYKTIHTKLRQYGIKKKVKANTQEKDLSDPTNVLRFGRGAS